jgi:hypothetical protein
MKAPDEEKSPTTPHHVCSAMSIYSIAIAGRPKGMQHSIGYKRSVHL